MELKISSCARCAFRAASSHFRNFEHVEFGWVMLCPKCYKTPYKPIVNVPLIDVGDEVMFRSGHFATVTGASPSGHQHAPYLRHFDNGKSYCYNQQGFTFSSKLSPEDIVGHYQKAKPQPVKEGAVLSILLEQGYEWDKHLAEVLIKNPIWAWVKYVYLCSNLDEHGNAYYRVILNRLISQREFEHFKRVIISNGYDITITEEFYYD